MLLNRIRLENLLSFSQANLELLPLNVLIGANASGKSNLIRSIHLLRSLPKGIGTTIAEGGGIRDWVNKRTEGIASIAIWNASGSKSDTEHEADPDYEICLRAIGQDFEIPREVLKGAFSRAGSRLNPFGPLVSKDDFLPNLPQAASVLEIFRSPREEKIWPLAQRLEAIRLYREFQTGPGTPTRNGSSASAFKGYLSEDGGNLAGLLDKMRHLGESVKINDYLHRFYEGFTEAYAYSAGAITQTFVREKGLGARNAVSAVALSDGTLRVLCLLVVLLDPEPPPLACIEEPEIGLHPDAIRMIAELLVQASQRTQLIVTTHSPALIDALSDRPESVVVCERDFDGFTQFKRLKSADLERWLERYSLGELWQKGEIGGNRW